MSRTIIWDVDDVLNDLMGQWLVAWRLAHPARFVDYGELLDNPPDALLGISRDEYLSSLDEFRVGAAYAKMAPDPDILAWLEENGGRCRHIALTSTSLRAAPTTGAWVFRHFGRWIREFSFIPTPRAGENLLNYDADKGTWLARLGIPAVLVDDSPQNLAAATAAGAVALCWPRPWNNGVASIAKTLQALTRLIDTGDAR